MMEQLKWQILGIICNSQLYMKMFLPLTCFLQNCQRFHHFIFTLFSDKCKLMLKFKLKVLNRNSEKTTPFIESVQVIQTAE